MAGKQVNFVLPEELVDVLDAVAFVETSTPTGYLKELAIDHLESRQGESEVEAALRARAENQARKSRKLHRLAREPASSES